MKTLIIIISFLGRIITACLFIGGLWLLADQVNSVNTGGSLLGIALLIVLVWNILLKDEIRAMQKRLRDANGYAQYYWEHDGI